ncbi:uroporphyrinogen-III synthase [Citricoccus nitrophenolicus]|uniref:Uroporphyrinogen-III synthase n=1 Tax=Citricoccus nitrophenolicus TaxID=863575 RepID=A0ABV0IHB5_9MICC|nr:uroporphyrinogen-III synthase [Citricoccus sp. I39-566]WMY78219.1 uroporphyrinogen-III synthase [Citricoccus sp. I39-566]
MSTVSHHLPQTLAGFRIGVTSDRRSEDLISAFERRGAEVMHAPALRIAPLTESVTLHRDTRRVIAALPDYTVITTAYGMRRWVEAADAYGLGTDLHRALAASAILVRGPKARGAVLAAGLQDTGAPEDERTASLVDLLLARNLHGRTVAFQLHGMLDHQQVGRLEQAGARVLTVMPYTWARPAEDSALLRMMDAVIERQLEVLTFTAAPAVEAFLAVAQQYGRLDRLLEALRTEVATAVVGKVTAGPLHEAGLQPLIPARWRLGAMIRLVCDHLEQQQVLRLDTRLGPLEIRGAQVHLTRHADEPVRLPPGPLALLRELVDARGAVLSRQHLLAALRHCESEHALEMLVWRLRRHLPVPGLVTTVVKRGYRLAV